jgi:hypothetical protein
MDRDPAPEIVRAAQPARCRRRRRPARVSSATHIPRPAGTPGHTGPDRAAAAVAARPVDGPDLEVLITTQTHVHRTLPGGDR